MVFSRSSSRGSTRNPSQPAPTTFYQTENSIRTQHQGRGFEQMSLSEGVKKKLSSTNSSSVPAPVSDVPVPAYSTSVVPSPEPLRGRDLDPVPISSFQLSDPSLSRRKSESTLKHTPPRNNYPAGGSSTSISQESSRPNGNIFRRLSNRASKAIPRRRPSSAHPNSRDVSVGPGIVRRRSDSNNTAPSSDVVDRSTIDTESDYDADERDDGESIATSNFDGLSITDTSAHSNGTSLTSGLTTTGITPTPAWLGPVIPLALLHGITMRKVSKKNNSKRIVLALDAEAGKITWDKLRSSKCLYIDDIKEIRVAEDIRQYRLDCNVPASEESRFFSILYTVPDTTQTKTMHLIADTDENFADWTVTLDAIYRHRQDLIASLMAFDDRAVRSYWHREIAKQPLEKPTLPSTAALAGEIGFAGVERICRNLHIHVPQDTIRRNFDDADKSKTGRLNYSGFQDFVRMMKKRSDIHVIYRAVAANSSLGITKEEFLDFLRSTQGENVDDELALWEAVFARFTGRFKTASAASSTKDSALSSDGDSAVYATEEGLRMSEASFASFLTSTYNLSTIKEPKNYSFDRPMNEYYISSSHNTYLVGRQLKGTSSVEGYISALTRGCRCVEIDCWDGTDGQPIVVHGKTLTSSISFREAVNAINRYAFVKSPFPLWISLEVHCSPEQQRIMARVMREVFGSKLITEPLPNATNRLPTPTELRGRILIKTKKTQQPLTLPALPVQTSSEVITASTSEFTGRRRGNSLPTPFQRSLSLDSNNAPAAVYPPVSSQMLPLSLVGQSSSAVGPTHSVPSTSRKSSMSKTRMNTVNTITEGEVAREAPSSSTSDCDSATERLPVKQKQSKIVPELGCLAVYCVGVHKTTPFEALDCKLYNHILSWDETLYDKNTKSREHRHAVYFHNMRYLMRVYPKAYRFGSSNFNPLIHWRRGVQMSALNWQTYDLGMQLNAAMFTGGTDQSGYVLKPRECRQFQLLPNLPGESKPRELKRERKNVNFSIGIVSAQQLMRPVNLPDRRTLDPYIEVEAFMADDKRDCDESKQEQTDYAPLTPLLYRTKIAPGNGFNPVFDQRFNFRFTTKYPDLVFLRLSVKLAENGKYTNASPTATFTAKLSNLKQGFRTIPLVDANADRYMFSTLFCEIRKEPITSIFVPCPADMSESTNKLKSIRTVFNRTASISPKSSMDSGPP
ncbi:hypothetical protein SEPCBS119000_003697 [Sporothrix epigloea]|uniref:Phosphoinositide phospholipase C n=1 Tax=Sporothrix epigloea TaxID=1892477 RepID=A0ABP0DS97_9PEZI